MFAYLISFIAHSYLQWYLYCASNAFVAQLGERQTEEVMIPPHS